MNLVDLYRQRHKALQRYLRRLLRSEDEAADIAQEAFLRIYAAELGHQTPISEALLYTAARNLALSELRKRTSRATDSVADMSELDIEAVGSNPETAVSNRQMIAAVEAAMTRMPPRCLDVFRLRKVEGLSHAEIAERLDMSTKTVERHITHALRLCHEAFAAHRPTAGRRAAP